MQIEVKIKCHRRFWRLDFRRYSARKTAIIDLTYISNRDLWSRGRLLRSRSFGRPDLRAGARVLLSLLQGLGVLSPPISCRLLPRENSFAGIGT